jgi:hypothetical protein
VQSELTGNRAIALLATGTKSRWSLGVNLVIQNDMVF